MRLKPALPTVVVKNSDYCAACLADLGTPVRLVEANFERLVLFHDFIVYDADVDGLGDLAVLEHDFPVLDTLVEGESGLAAWGASGCAWAVQRRSASSGVGWQRRETLVCCSRELFQAAPREKREKI